MRAPFFSYVAKSRADPGEDLMLLKAKSLGDPDFANYPPLLCDRFRAAGVGYTSVTRHHFNIF